MNSYNGMRKNKSATLVCSRLSRIKGVGERILKKKKKDRLGKKQPKNDDYWKRGG